jgi:hypothetical protein
VDGAALTNNVLERGVAARDAVDEDFFPIWTTQCPRFHHTRAQKLIPWLASASGVLTRML